VRRLTSSVGVASHVPRSPHRVVALRLSISAGLGLAGYAVARATKNVALVAAVPIAAMAGVTLWTVREAHQPTPEPADSTQTFYGMKSSPRWDNYVRGFKTTIDQQRDKAVKSSVIGTVVLSGLLLLELAFVKAAISHL